jgi:ankyrin repeat protein
MRKLLFLLLAFSLASAMEEKEKYFEPWLNLPTELKAQILNYLPLEFHYLSSISKEFEALVYIPEFQTGLAQAIIKRNPELAKKLVFKFIKLGNKQFVNAFIKAGFDTNSTDIHGMTLLMIAAKKGQTAIADQLLKHGAAVDVEDNRGHTAVTLAVQEDNTEIADLLLAYGADFNVRDLLGSTPLIIAAENGSINMVKWLLAHGAAVNARS